MSDEIIQINQSPIAESTEDVLLSGYVNNEGKLSSVRLSPKTIVDEIGLENYATTKEVDDKIKDITEGDPSFNAWKVSERLSAGKGVINTPTDGTVYGANATVRSMGGVAIGSKSAVFTSDVIAADMDIAPLSIGSSSENIKRRIINVANGLKDSDAVTLRQVKELMAGIDISQIPTISPENYSDSNFLFVGNKNNGDKELFMCSFESIMELLSERANSSKIWQFKGDLSTTGKAFVFEFENIRVNVSRINDSEVGVIFYSNIPKRIKYVTNHAGRWGSNTEKVNDLEITLTGKAIDNIKIDDFWLQTRIIDGDTVYKIEGFGFDSESGGIIQDHFTDCRVIVEKITLSETIEETAPDYLQRWQVDLSAVGSTLSIPVDDVIFDLSYKNAESIAVTVRPESSSASLAFNRTSIYTGTSEATWQDTKVITGVTNVDDTMYNDARDRCSVRFLTDKGSYELRISAFEKGKKVEALLYNYTEIGHE